MNTQQTRADMGTIGLVARERAHTILHEVLDRGRPLADRPYSKATSGRTADQHSTLSAQWLSPASHNTAAPLSSVIGV